MKAISLAAVLLLAGIPAFAHRLDEYLQATLLSIEKTRVQIHMVLTPGATVFQPLISLIDTDANHVITGAEQDAYVANVLRDLSLTLDGQRLTPKVLSAQFSTVDAMRQGLGEIRLVLEADVPAGGGNRKLTLENHHQSAVSAYLVNSLVPSDPDIRIASQVRNYSQSSYVMEYQQAGVPTVATSPESRTFRLLFLGGLAVLVFLRFALLPYRQKAADLAKRLSVWFRPVTVLPFAGKQPRL